MKRLLQFGFLLGLAATLAAGYFLPWIGYERYASATTAVINGGRGESFLIRLPNDRIHAAGNSAQTLGGGPHGTPVRTVYPAAAGLDGAAPTAVEHYKLRDVAGNVIGIATRHATETAAGAQVAWMLTLPSRGSVAFGGDDAAIDLVETALAGAGIDPGSAPADALVIERLPALASAAGTEEFAGIEFTLAETWTITSIDEQGVLHGTIALETVGRRGS